MSGQIFTKRLTQLRGTKEYHEFEARSGKLHNSNIHARATEHENPLFLVRLRRLQREKTRETGRGGGGRREGGSNEASIIIGHVRSDEPFPPPSLIAITGRSRGDRKVLTGNGIPADRINRTC